MGIATQLGSRIGAAAGDWITGEQGRNEQDRSLKQQLILIDQAGGVNTQAGQKIFNEGILPHPAYQNLMKGMQTKTFGTQDFAVSDPYKQRAADIKQRAADINEVKILSTSLTALQKMYKDPVTGEINQEAMDADSGLQNVKKMLGQSLARMNRQEQVSQTTPDSAIGGQLTGAGQPQPVRTGQPRTADLFVGRNPVEDVNKQFAYAEKWRPRFEAANAFMGKKVAETGVAELTAADEPEYRKQLALAKQVTAGKPAPQDQMYYDLADSFVDAQSSRNQAMQEGKAVVPNQIDQTDTTPKRMVDHGISDPDQQKDFADLEAMTQKTLPEGIDLRQSYSQNPQSYAKLLAAIKKGVPDGKGGTRKLSMKEILRAIQVMGY